MVEDNLQVAPSWNDERALLLIAESDLVGRFSYIETKLCSNKHVVQLQNITKRNIFGTLIERYRLMRSLKAEYVVLKKQLADVDYVFLSNTEGFIARNLVRWIKHEFPKIVIIGLQHGIFLLNRRNLRSQLISWVNRATAILLDFNFLGQGFSNWDVDYFIVYGSFYRSALLAYGIPKHRVIASTVLLKGEDFFRKKRANSKRNDNCIFLLQCLSALAITDRKTEAKLIASILSWLSARYELVYIKQHPYGAIELQHIPDNCRIVDEPISDLVKNAGTAVSFFSEGLLECEFLGLKTIAIFSGLLNVNPLVYELFASVWTVDQNWQLVEDRRFNRDSEYYESELSTPNELLTAISGFHAD